MPTPKFDREHWEALWTKTLREHADKVARRAPSSHLTAEVASLPPGRALDAGCGHGAETLWLAAHGWRVTAVDFSAAALAQGRALADAAGPEIAGRIEWIQADIGEWVPDRHAYDLVMSLYVHVAKSVVEMVERLSRAVADGGTLLLVGHRPIDPQTGAPTPAANQTQVSVEEAKLALASDEWEIACAEERPRSIAGSGVDAFVRARARRITSPM